jgi:hypothetical protein
MAVDYIPDHPERAEENRLSQFDKSTLIKAIVKLGVDEVQLLEDTLFALVWESLVDTAQGAQLDQYGKLSGEPREGLIDKEYRNLIKVSLRAKRSNGQPEVITSVVADLVELVGGVRYIPLYPAGYALDYLVSQRTAGTYRDRIVKLLLDITPAGVLLSDVKEGVLGYWGFEGDPNALPLGVGAWTTELLIPL